MIEANSYEQIKSHLNETYRAKFGSTSCTRLTGFLFAPPHSEISAKSIVPKLNYYHVRSDYYLDFYCIGYGAYLPVDEFSDAVEVTKIQGVPWQFSDRVFNNLRSEFEDNTDWNFSGEVDLMLASTIWNGETAETAIEFKDSLVITPDLMILDKAITSFPRLFEEICRFAERTNTDLLTNSKTTLFSDVSGLKALGKAGLESLIGLLPEICQNVWKNAVHFRTVNLDKGEMGLSDRALNFLKS